LDGDRIAQIVFQKVEKANWELVQALDSTERGTGGFGHTGKK
jgi:dUTP pyrophosphatase